jgi:hypothetical protein
MRTAPSKIFLIIFLIFFTSGLFAQPSTVDDEQRYRTKPFDRFWTRQRLVPEVGVGLQDRFFLEVGLQWHNIYKHPFTLMSKGPYTTVDIFVDDSNLLVGPKLGYEFTAGVFGLASDITYFIDHNYNGEGSTRRSVVATPKLGLTLLGFANLYYGYQIPLTDQRITSLSRNRFSLVFTLNRDYFALKEAPRK